MSYVIYHTKSGKKGFVCIFVIVDSLTNKLGWAETYRMQETILYQLFCSFFDENNPVFCQTNSLGKILDTRQNKFCEALLRPRLTLSSTGLGLKISSYNQNSDLYSKQVFPSLTLSTGVLSYLKHPWHFPETEDGGLVSIFQHLKLGPNKLCKECHTQRYKLS